LCLVQLPIELSIFEGENKGDINQLVWLTESENNTNYFEVQKSIDGYNWNKLGLVNGAGNSINSNEYNYIDEEVLPLCYYRSVQVDLNGESTLSYPISISSLIQNDELTIYPNPINNSEMAHLTGLKNGDHLQVYDNNGRLILEQIIEKENLAIYNLDVSAFNKGIYLLYSTALNNETSRSKFIVQ